MLEEIPYFHLASVTDEEPPTHHSLLLNMAHRVSVVIHVQILDLITGLQ